MAANGFGLGVGAGAVAGALSSHTIDFEIDIQIGELVVETRAEQALQAQRIPELLRKAFNDLANKIRSSPAGFGTNVANLVLEKIELSGLTTDMLLGPAGAERLSEELYAKLTRGT